MADLPDRPVPKWLLGHDRAETNRKAKANEHRIAKAFGGRRLSRSGGHAWHKTDATTDQGDAASLHFLIEHKHTINESLSLKKEWLRKVEDGARRKLRDPALVITFEAEDKRDREDWVLIPLPVFQRLMEKAGLSHS